jgi:hypothetical protein
MRLQPFAVHAGVSFTPGNAVRRVAVPRSSLPSPILTFAMVSDRVCREVYGCRQHTYKYAFQVGSAQRLENGNTLILFGADADPTALLVKNPQTFTLVEADARPEAGALAVLDVQIPPGNGQVYRAIPVETLFGEVPGVTLP